MGNHCKSGCPLAGLLHARALGKVAREAGADQADRVQRDEEQRGAEKAGGHREKGHALGEKCEVNFHLHPGW